MKNIKKYIIVLCFFLFTIPAYTQVLKGIKQGFNIGIISAIGNKFQRIGFTLQSYTYTNEAQLNTELRIYHNFKNLGPAKQYNELVASIGLVYAYGIKQKENNPFFSSISNQTNYASSVGYSYNFYFNKIHTTQQTGIIAFQFNNLSIITENDIFARPTLDRFRTGAFLVQYQYKNLYQFAVNCTMWTGQMGNKISSGKNFPFSCYMDTTHGVYTNYSHGLLSGQFKYAVSNSQNVQANLGIDAEQVRNFVQNRLIHDMIFIPKKWHKSKNCHIPMLDSEGKQYLYKPNQKIKKTQSFWNLFTGTSIFY